MTASGDCRGHRDVSPAMHEKYLGVHGKACHELRPKQAAKPSAATAARLAALCSLQAVLQLSIARVNFQACAATLLQVN